MHLGSLKNTSDINVVKKMVETNHIKSEETSSKKIWRAGELATANIPAPSWIVDRIVGRENICILAGAEGTCKSFLSQVLSLHVGRSQQGAVLGFDVKPGRVLILDEENGLVRLKDRLISLAKGYDLDLENVNVDFALNHHYKLNSPIDKRIDDLDELIERIKPDLIIVDSLTRFLTGDENNSEDVRKLHSVLVRLINRHHCAWLLLHHVRKNGGRDTNASLRGSSDFSAMADLVWIIKKEKDTFLLRNTKCRDNTEAEPIRFKLIKTSTGGHYLEQVDCPEMIISPSVLEEAKKIAIGWITKEKICRFEAKQLVVELKSKGIGYTAVYAVLKEFQLAGILKKLKKGIYQVCESDGLIV